MNTAVEKQFKIPGRIYRNNLAVILVMAGAAILCGVVGEFVKLWVTLWPLIAGLGTAILIVAFLIPGLRKLNQIISLNIESITCQLGHRTVSLRWNDVGQVRGAFDAQDILVIGKDPKNTVRINRFTEELDELVNTILRRVPSAAIGRQKNESRTKRTILSAASPPDVMVEDGTVILNKSKGIERIPLNEITGLRLEFGNKQGSALAALIIDRQSTPVGAVGLYYRLIDGYGVIARALELHSRRSNNE